MSRKEQNNFNNMMGTLLNNGGASKSKKAQTKLDKPTEKDWSEELEFEEVKVPENLDAAVAESDKIIGDIMKNIASEIEDAAAENNEANVGCEAESSKNGTEDSVMSGLKTDDTNKEVKAEETNNMVEGRKPETVTAIIPAGAIIKGNLEFNTDLSIAGQIEGDIKCEKTIYVRTGAIIKGNLEADSIFIEGTELTGDLKAKSKVEISGKSALDGNITAGNVLLDGIVKGNITASEMLDIRDNGKVKGDIKANLLESVKGATICGMVEVGAFKE